MTYHLKNDKAKVEMITTYIPERAMFIYAHPDDIEYSVAGTARVWVKGGCQVTYVLVTDGDMGNHESNMTSEKLAQIRRCEQIAAAKIIGANCVFLGYPDGLLQATLELRKALVRLIRLHRPNTVVCGDPALYFLDDFMVNHPDHRAVAQAAVDAVFPAVEMPMLYPDLQTEGLKPHKVNYLYISYPVQNANCVVDITHVMESKIKALRQHTSQLGNGDPTELLQRWGSSIGKQFGVTYGEIFRKIFIHPEKKKIVSGPKV